MNIRMALLTAPWGKTQFFGGRLSFNWKKNEQAYLEALLPENLGSASRPAKR